MDKKSEQALAWTTNLLTCEDLSPGWVPYHELVRVVKWDYELGSGVALDAADYQDLQAIHERYGG